MPTRIRSPRAARLRRHRARPRHPAWLPRAGRRARAAAACASRAGAARCRSANASASSWVAVATLSRSRPVAGDRHLGVDPASRQPPGSNQSADRASAPRRCSAPAAPGRPASGPSRRRTRRRCRAWTGPGRRAGDHPAASRSRSSSTSHRRPLAAGQRQDLHAERLAVRDEPLVERLRPQPLGDGGQRRSRGRAARPRRESQLPQCGRARITPRPLRAPRPGCRRATTSDAVAGRSSG